MSTITATQNQNFAALQSGKNAPLATTGTPSATNATANTASKQRESFLTTLLRAMSAFAV